MNCELCHKAAAETAIRKTADGEEQELYVCKACACEASRPTAAAAEASGRTGGAVPLMGVILDAAFEVAGRTANSGEPACPACGITRAEYRKASRLGCPACYDAFARELESAVLELHRCLQHAGKSPAKARAAWQLRQLLTELDEAVKGQRYEEAIALRDRIQKLEADGSGGGGRG